MSVTSIIKVLLFFKEQLLISNMSNAMSIYSKFFNSLITFNTDSNPALFTCFASGNFIIFLEK